MKEKWAEYNGYLIHASQVTSWCIYKKPESENSEEKNKLILSDCRTIDGSPLYTIDEALSDAKKNIDTMIRLNLLKDE